MRHAPPDEQIADCVACIPSLCCTGLFFFFNDTATTEIYTLSLHDALPISRKIGPGVIVPRKSLKDRSEGFGVSEGVVAESFPLIWHLRWKNSFTCSLNNTKGIYEFSVLDQLLLVRGQTADLSQHRERAREPVRVRLSHCALKTLYRNADIQRSQKNQSIESRVMGDYCIFRVVQCIPQVNWRDRILPGLPDLRRPGLEGIGDDETFSGARIKVCARGDIYFAERLCIQKQQLQNGRSA